MSLNSNKFTRFWKELKRRRVIHVITVYASASFVIIELVNNLTEPLNLPPNLATIVIVVLAVGFPLAVILSWLYDLTGKGVEKTKPIEEVKDGEKTVVPNAWKIATIVSFVVIIGLVTFNIVGGTKQLRAGDIQSLLILPFDNLSGDDRLDYVAAGMHSSLIGDVGQFSGLRVISKTTASIYKNLEMSLPQIATELNTDAIVEPTFMCYGDSVCIQIRVITPFPEERQLWVAEYKEERSQIENLYNRVAKQIAEEIMVELSPEEERLMAVLKTVNPDAHDAYLRGMYHWEQFTEEGFMMALEYFNKAIEIDPDWAPPYAGIAYFWIAIRQSNLQPSSVTIPSIYEYLDKARQLDPQSINTLYVSALASIWTEFNWEKGEQELLKVLEINPNHALSHVYYAHLLMILKKENEAFDHANTALDLDPLNPMVQSLSAIVFAYSGEYERGIEIAQSALVAAPGNEIALSALSIAHAYKKDYLNSLEYYLAYVDLEEKARLDVLNTYDKDGFKAATKKLAEEYTNTDHPLTLEIGTLYAMSNNYSKAMDWLEKTYDDHDANAPYISMNFFSKGPFKIDDPRLDDILKKMNLPQSED